MREIGKRAEDRKRQRDISKIGWMEWWTDRWTDKAGVNLTPGEAGEAPRKGLEGLRGALIWAAPGPLAPQVEALCAHAAPHPSIGFPTVSNPYGQCGHAGALRLAWR